MVQNLIAKWFTFHLRNTRNEYILDKEFRVATYDKDGNEIEENDHTNT